MKKIVSLLLFTLILNGCDDGNLSVDSINFDDVQPQSCTNGIIYKINNNESLLMQLSDSILDEPSAANTPQLFDIDNTSNRVIYRAYNGDVSSENICSTIPPALPTVTTQWTATGGTIQVFTTQIVSTDETNNSTRITGYNHNITFKNITFLKPDGPQVYADFGFGDYKTTAPTLNLTFKTTAEQCTTSKQVYNYNSSASLTIDSIDPKLLDSITEPGVPKVGYLGTTTNKLSYKVYSDGVLSASYFCNASTPILPAVSQTWLGINGVEDVSGMIEVVTETNGPNTFKHTITLKKVTLQKGTSSFKLGDTFLLGELFTTTTTTTNR